MCMYVDMLGSYVEVFFWNALETDPLKTERVLVAVFWTSF